MHIGEVKQLLLKEKTVCVNENIYDMICAIHDDLQHAAISWAPTFMHVALYKSTTYDNPSISKAHVSVGVCKKLNGWPWASRLHELEDIPNTTVSLIEVARRLALVNSECQTHRLFNKKVFVRGE